MLFRFPVIVFSALLLLLTLNSPVRAQLISETFRNNSVAGWVLQGDACLTAPGGALSCPNTPPNYNDPAGEGWLRLTTSDNDQVAHVISEGSVPFGEGIALIFEYAMYAGTPFEIPNIGPFEGDGISVFLTDASVPNNGAIDLGGEHFGGSLGYCGMVGAVIGMGLDRFGNFSWTMFSDCGDGPEILPDHIVIRAGASDVPVYRLLSTQPADGLLRTDPGWPAPDGARAGRRLTFRVVGDEGCAGTPWRITLHNDTDDVSWVDSCLGDLAGIDFQPPADVRVGFSGATGAATQFQEVRMFEVRQVLDAPLLTIIKTASQPVFMDGEAASYTLTVTNIGGSATTEPAFVNDLLPAMLTPGPMPEGCVISGQQVTCTIPPGLAVSESVSFEISVTPFGMVPTLQNTATVEGGGDPGCPQEVERCQSTVEVEVSCIFDLSGTGCALADSGLPRMAFGAAIFSAYCLGLVLFRKLRK